jgi:hypothetical protein
VLIEEVIKTMDIRGQEEATFEVVSALALYFVHLVDHDWLSDRFDGVVVAHFYISFGWVLVYTTEKACVFWGLADERSPLRVLRAPQLFSILNARTSWANHHLQRLPEIGLGRLT